MKNKSRTKKELIEELEALRKQVDELKDAGSKRTEKESEKRLREAQRIAQIGSWELDLVSNKLIWSDEIYRIFEIDQKAFGASYDAFLQAVHPEDRAMVDKAYTYSVKSRTPYEIVHRLLMPDGRIKFVQERCETFYDSDGNPIRSVGTVQDITERKKAEEKLKEEIETTTNLLLIAEATAQVTDIDKLMREVIHCGRKITGYDICLSYLWDKEARVFMPSQEIGLSHDLIPIFRTEHLNVEVEFVKKAFVTKKPEIIESDRSKWFEPLQWIKDINTIIVSPLIGTEDYLGFIVGVYVGTDIKAFHKFNERDRKIIMAVISHVTNALEQARLYRESIDKTVELSQSLETIRVMHEIDRSILSTLESEAIMETVIRMVGKIIPYDYAVIGFVDNERQGFTFTYAASFGIAVISKGAFVSFGDTSTTEVIKTRRPQYISNLMYIKTLPPFEKKLLQESFLSHVRVPLTVKDEVVGVLNIGAKRATAFTRENLLTLDKLASQISVALSNAGLIKDLEDLFMGMVRSLSKAIDTKSRWTGGHSERVTKYSIDIGKEMGLSEKELKDIELAGLLHDIGKIGTYESILDKPGKLTNEEFEIVKKHPAQGAGILQDIKQLKDIIPFIRHHHERIDGRGYPDGLRGEDIPLGARILHVADTFDAIMADRPYRPSPGIEYAISELKKYSGTQFDPKVAEVFLRVIGKS